MLEFYKLAALRGVKPLDVWPALIGCLLILLAFFVKLHKVPTFGYVVLLPMLFLLFIAELFRKQENPIANIAWSVLGIIYIALPMALLAYMPVQPAMYGYVVYRPLIVLNIFVLVWANDVGAYLLGMLLGRHKMGGTNLPEKRRGKGLSADCYVRCWSGGCWPIWNTCRSDCGSEAPW